MAIGNIFKVEQVEQHLVSYTNIIKNDNDTKEFIDKTRIFYKNKLSDKNGEENLKAELIQLENEKINIKEFNPFNELSAIFSLFGFIAAMCAIIIPANSDKSEIESVLNSLSNTFYIIGMFIMCMMLIYFVIKYRVEENNANKNIALNIHISIIKDIINSK